MLNELGSIFDKIDPEYDPIRRSRQNSISWQTATGIEYLNNQMRKKRPGPPWHQFGRDLLLNLNEREKHGIMIPHTQKIGHHINARQQALSMIYPPGGYLAWHTNADVPGRNLILTWSKEGKGVFKYRNTKTGVYLNIPDKKGWNIKSFDWHGFNEADRRGLTWHSAGTECLRVTIAYVIKANQLSDDLLQEDFNLNEIHPGCFLTDDHVNVEFDDGS